MGSIFNPDGTDLQREALKWGTTPKYYDGSYDYDFVGWTNKKGQPKELKPITGNTYFYAKYEIGKVVHHSSGGGSNPPGSPPYVPNCTETTTLVKIIEHKYMLGSWQGYRYIIYEYNSVSGQFEESRTIPGGSNKTICGSTDYAGVELNKFYHATLGWSDTLSWIGPECVTPGPDHGISVD